MDREAFWARLADVLAGATGRREPGRVLVVGLSAPQGAGKTTLTRELVRRLAGKRVKAAAVSLDDFYLTRTEQAALSARHPGNPYLKHRGLPGTHDPRLAVDTVRVLVEAQGSVSRPSYDKTKFSGLGDRAEAATWPTIEGPLDLVLVEGWMLGFLPVPDASIADLDFRVVNEELARYQPLWAAFDVFVWLEPDDVNHVRRWRAEAEAAAIAAGKEGMTPDEVDAFVTLFFKAYETYLPRMRQDWPPAVPHLHIVIGGDRLPLSEAFELVE